MTENQIVFYDPCNIPPDSPLIPKKDKDFEALMKEIRPLVRIEKTNRNLKLNIKHHDGNQANRD